MTPLSQVYWYQQRARPRRELPPLGGNAEVEMVVVGGGVAGLTCAHALSERGHKVVVLERSFCGSGASGRSSGFITPDSEMELSDLVRSRGPERARRLWEFVVSGVDEIRGNIQGYRIDCDYQVQDSLFLANSPKGASKVIREHDARTRMGYESTLYDAHSIRSVLTSKECCGGVRYSGTFGINAYLYCQVMRDILRESGVTIHEQSRVTEIGDGSVTANGYMVRADHVLLCVDHFLPELGELTSEVYHLQTFLGVTTPLSDAQISTVFPESRLMVWDSDLIYQYFRITGDNRLLIGGSSVQYAYARKQHAAAPRIVRKMLAFARRKFPQLPVEIEYFWPGLIGVSKDFVPLAGQDATRPTISFVTGATGLAWAAALGRYMAEKVVSGRSDLDEEFDPGRSFVIGASAQRLMGKSAAFALSHGVVKLLR